MELNRDIGEGTVIHSFSTGDLRVNDQRITSHVILTPREIISDWSPPPIDQLTVADFRAALDQDPEVVLFGTGPTQRFPGTSLMAAIMQQGVGFEVMDTGAACRTFNILVAENRRVVAALLVT